MIIIIFIKTTIIVIDEIHNHEFLSIGRIWNVKTVTRNYKRHLYITQNNKFH